MSWREIERTEGRTTEPFTVKRTHLGFYGSSTESSTRVFGFVTWRHHCGALATAITDASARPPKKCGKCGGA